MDSTSSWIRIFEVLGLSSEPLVLAVAPRGSGAIAEALSRVAPHAHITALHVTPCHPDDPVRARDLPLPVEQIAATAPDLPTRLSVHAFDLALFDHAIDDIICAAIAAKEGIAPGPGRAARDPQPVMRALRAYWRTGELHEIAASAVTELLEVCRVALRPRGRLILTHQVFDSDLRLGQPLELYADYIPLARKWISEAGLPLRELALDGLDPQWSLCLEEVL